MSPLPVPLLFRLSSQDRADALEVAAGRASRPAELLEKDIWVVWALDPLFQAPFGNALTFKVGRLVPFLKLTPSA